MWMRPIAKIPFEMKEDRKLEDEERKEREERKKEEGKREKWKFKKKRKIAEFL